MVIWILYSRHRNTSTVRNIIFDTLLSNSQKIVILTTRSKPCMSAGCLNTTDPGEAYSISILYVAIFIQSRTKMLQEKKARQVERVKAQQQHKGTSAAVQRNT